MSVYFVRSGDSDFVKIGSADDAAKRVAGLQCGNPYLLTLLGCIDGGQVAEKRVHRALAYYRRRAEWFEADAAKRFLCIAQTQSTADAERVFLEETAERKRLHRAHHDDLTPRFNSAVQNTLLVLARVHGTQAVCHAMQIKEPALRKSLRGACIPQVWRLWNLLHLDLRAMDEVASLYGLKVIEAEADGTKTHVELLNMETELREAGKAIDHMLATIADLRRPREVA